RNPFTHLELAEEGLEAWTVGEVWVQTRGADANRYVDVTETFDRKLEALRAHESQTSHMDNLEDMLRMWLTMNAQAAGFAEGRLAEAYRVLDTR
ncbi:MAG: hypothetical protein QOI82_3067, partial [Actinomycetota bacterium]|nr:hypothetical protein [Actinomycetota bacterium]